MTKVLAGVALMLMTSAAHAQMADGQDACQSDAMRLCKDAVPDEDRIAACLKQNRAKLTPACRKSFNARAKAKGM